MFKHLSIFFDFFYKFPYFLYARKKNQGVLHITGQYMLAVANRRLGVPFGQEPVGLVLIPGSDKLTKFEVFVNLILVRLGGINPTGSCREERILVSIMAA